MNRPSVRGIRGREPSRGDRAGPALLLALLAVAFVPSVLQEFDAASLFSAIREAMGRMALPVQLILPACDPPLAVLPSIEGRSRIATVGFPAAQGPALPAADPGSSLRPASFEGGSWRPPGLVPSPRAPPPQA